MCCCCCCSRWLLDARTQNKNTTHPMHWLAWHIREQYIESGNEMEYNSFWIVQFFLFNSHISLTITIIVNGGAIAFNESYLDLYILMFSSFCSFVCELLVVVALFAFYLFDFGCDQYELCAHTRAREIGNMSVDCLLICTPIEEDSPRTQTNVEEHGSFTFGDGHWIV